MMNAYTMLPQAGVKPAGRNDGIVFFRALEDLWARPAFPPWCRTKQI